MKSKIKEHRQREAITMANVVFSFFLFNFSVLLLSGSEINVALSDNNNSNHTLSDDSNECMVREQDRFMPIANVIRIMRKILPPHAKISDDAKETIQECVSEYISFITGEANDRCQREQRKTITAEDVLWAMSKLGFDDYIEPLTLYLHRYRELEGDRCSLRAEPLVKRSAVSMEYSGHGHVGIKPPLGITGFAARGFHVGNNHPHGFYGGSLNMAGGGYIKEVNSDGPSTQSAVGAGGDTQAQCK